MLPSEIGVGLLELGGQLILGLMRVVQLLFGRRQAGLRLDDVRRQQRGGLGLIEFDFGVEQIGLGFVERRLAGRQVGLGRAGLDQVKLGLARALARRRVRDRGLGRGDIGGSWSRLQLIELGLRRCKGVLRGDEAGLGGGAIGRGCP